jgi:phosphatidylglycerophosphate synthase
MTISNKITLSRTILGPLIFGSILSGQRFLAIFILISNAFFDWTDGFVARRRNEVTKMGETIDPFVDLLFFAFISFAIYLTGINQINWVFLPIFLIILSFFILRIKGKKIDILHTKTKYLHTPFLYLSAVLIILDVQFWPVFFALTILIFSAASAELFFRSLCQ